MSVVDDQRRMDVLGLHADIMGHSTYRAALTACLSPSERVDYVALSVPAELAVDWVGRAGRKFLAGDYRSQGPFYRLRSELASSLLADRVWIRYKRTSTPAVLHIHTQALSLLLLRSAARMPLVISGDATAALLATCATSRPTQGWAVLRGLERRAFLQADQIVCWSDWAACSVREDYGIPDTKVMVVPPPILVGEQIPRPRSDDCTDPVILFVGNDFIRKGGRELVEVFRALSVVCRLVVVSRDPIAASLAQSDPRITVHTKINDPRQMSDIYRSANVFVFPSHEEAYGLTLVEAMWHGLPVVTTNVMAIPEVVGGPSLALLVPPNDRRRLAEAITYMVTNPEFRSRLGDSGRRFVRSRHDPSRIRGTYEQIFSTLAVGQHPRGPRAEGEVHQRSS